MLLENTLEGPLDSKIKLVNPKGNQYWIFIRSSNTLATWCEELTDSKSPWCWERLKVGGEGDDRGWMASPTWWTWVWVSFQSWWWTGKPGVLKSMGSQRVWHDWVTELNCTDNLFGIHVSLLVDFAKKFRFPASLKRWEGMWQRIHSSWSWETGGGLTDLFNSVLPTRHPPALAVHLDKLLSYKWTVNLGD